MNEIILNLQTPAWWFTTFFPIIIVFLLGIFLKKLKEPTKKYFRHVFSKNGLIGKLFRKSKLKELQKIRKIRKDDILVTQEIVKTYTYLILFILSGFILFSIFIIFSNASREIGQLLNTDFFTFIFLVLFITSPAYLFEYLYLKQNDFLKNILRYRKPRIK